MDNFVRLKVVSVSMREQCLQLLLLVTQSHALEPAHGIQVWLRCLLYFRLQTLNLWHQHQHLFLFSLELKHLFIHVD